MYCHIIFNFQIKKKKSQPCPFHCDYEEGSLSLICSHVSVLWEENGTEASSVCAVVIC